MLKTVGSLPAEAGGLLFGSRTDWVITKFLYDKDAETTCSTYSFNVGYLNPMIDKLDDEGLQLLGFVHSHPPNAKRLSEPDKKYFLSQFDNISVDKFLVPLMFPAVDGTYDFVPYVIYKDGRVEQSDLELLPDNHQRFVQVPPERLPPIPTEAGVVVSPVNMFSRYYRILWSTFLTGLLLLSLCLMRFFYLYLKHTLTL